MAKRAASEGDVGNPGTARTAVIRGWLEIMSNHQNNRVRFYNQKVLFGCGSVIFLFFLLIASSLIYAIRQDRRAAQYPGSIPMSEHNNYKRLLTQYRWDNSYKTDDSFNDVYNWYSVKFEMGAESRANGNCILLEETDQWLRMERYMSVFICGTPKGQMIFVSRSTSIR